MYLQHQGILLWPPLKLATVFLCSALVVLRARENLLFTPGLACSAGESYRNFVQAEETAAESSKTHNSSHVTSLVSGQHTHTPGTRSAIRSSTRRWVRNSAWRCGARRLRATHALPPQTKALPEVLHGLRNSLPSSSTSKSTFHTRSETPRT